MPLATRAHPPLWVAALLPLALADAVPPTRPLTIISTGRSEPLFVAYRGEHSNWTVLTRSESGYIVPVPAPRFTVVAVCPASFDLEEVDVFHLANRDAQLLPIHCGAEGYPRTRTPVTFVDPATQVVVGDQHAAVQTDGRGNIVNRDSEVHLRGDRADWISTSSNPHRVLLTHDVPISDAHRSITVAGGAAPDLMAIHVAGIAPDHPASPTLSFMSRNGTYFHGLGEHRPGVWQIVPRTQRLAGDYDLVHSTLLVDDQGYFAEVSAGVANAPTSVTVALPTARPTRHIEGRRISWTDAKNPNLITLHYADDTAEWTIRASQTWLGSATSYEPIDTAQIPRWQWSPPPSTPTAIQWHWTSDRRSLPFDETTPPSGITYTRVVDRR